jgi:predicted anti-sigma-YlaC factor YlaD
MANDPRCRQIRRLLPLVAGDAEGSDLSWVDRRLVDRHLIGCTSCRAHRDSMASAISVLKLAASVSPVSQDVPSVWPDLARQIRGTRHPHPTRWFGLGFGGSVGLAASLLLLGTVIGLLGSRLAPLPTKALTPASFTDATLAPRPAVPETSPLRLLVGQPTSPPKSEVARPSIDLDSKGAASHLRDPQRSQ